MADAPSGLDDAGWMSAALALARRGLGTVAPNPAVGCILVKNGRVVGRGWTQPGGRPHGETEALRQAGTAASGAVAYVSLEPCAHYGKTPPCTEALLASGIQRAVIACEDPDPRVSGSGIRRLREAGIAVTVGVLAEAAREINAGFFLRMTEGRPLVTLKLATTLDGRIATLSGESRWITGETARSWGHLLRARNDAILVGVDTVIADDPDLTCRLPGLAHRSPVRVVVDSRLRLPLTSRLVRTARDVPTWVLALQGTDRARKRAFEDCGVDIIEVGADAGGILDLGAGLRSIGGRGITRVVAEGGARIAASLIRNGLADRIEWFRAPCVIGGDGIPAVAGIGIETISESAGFVRTGVRRAGRDLAETYARRP